MKRYLLVPLALLILGGCAMHREERNLGVLSLGKIPMSETAYKEYFQVKTAGVNGPDVTLVVERHCDLFNGAWLCTRTGLEKGDAPGAGEVLLGEVGEIAIGAGIAAFGALYDGSTYSNYARGGGGGAGGRGVGIGNANATITNPPMMMPMD